MDNLLSAAEMKLVDSLTINKLKISSLQLMEKAASAFVDVFLKNFPDRSKRIMIFCGPGNNGGDGLAIARLLHGEGFSSVQVCLRFGGREPSADCAANLERIKSLHHISILFERKQINYGNLDIIIDALIGSGLNRSFTGEYEELAKSINQSGAKVVSVDIPSGFPSEGEIALPYSGVFADMVVSFQVPKINFFFPESVHAFLDFAIVDIGLDKEVMQSFKGDFKLNGAPVFPERKRFSHKGTFGHALIVAGSAETMGAAILAAKSCLEAGAGLTTLCIPIDGRVAVNTCLPEVMVIADQDLVGDFELEKYNAVAVGPGLGTSDRQIHLLETLISKKVPLVLDADALNIIAKHKDLIDKLAPQSVLTPHLKEFDRLFGPHQNWWQRVERARLEAEKREVFIVLKNQYTFICLPNGQVYINQTGNPAMASGGMGDVLTGTIASFLAQFKDPEFALKSAVYMHGLAGDELAKSLRSLRASSVAAEIPKLMRVMTS